MTFAQLALICAVGLFGPLLSLPRRFRLPVVIGELLVGIVVGRTGFRLLDAHDTTFSFLAEIGFALVMFVAGSHVPVRDSALRAGLKVGAARAVVIGVLAVPVGLGIARLFDTGHGGIYAVLIASSSASLVLPALEDVSTRATEIVRMLPQVAIADAACIVALPLALDPSRAGRSAFGALAVIACGAVLFLGLRWLVGSGRQRRIHRVSETHDLAIELRFSLTVLFALAAVAAATHVSVMLAGFVVGLAVSGAGEPHRLAKQLFALTDGFFAPVFFVWLGASLDLRELSTHPDAIVLGVVLGVAACIVHLVPAVAGQPWPVAAITCAQLGVPVAAAALGTSLDLLRPGEATAMLLGAMVTVSVTAFVAPRVHRIDARSAT
ncbi:cation:proton antiporter [Calidifontibacter indicus]|uniref:Transporter (CPA2 family) n=1 Tax=Calidifontibacter indicus TaxID=419650 RepID=A0A3D9UQ22_9MICO|nr:cation:proton antiporter [Calidifontibacter indicus]REF30563.1 transporter (CPA2 family) [Calidifontibacter indicus]